MVRAYRSCIILGRELAGFGNGKSDIGWVISAFVHNPSHHGEWRKYFFLNTLGAFSLSVGEPSFLEIRGEEIGGNCV